MKKIYSILLLLIVISSAGLGYYQYSNAKSINQEAQIDSNKYFDVILGIQTIEDLKTAPLTKIQHLNSPIYQNLANLIVTNQNALKMDSNIDADLIKKHLADKKTDKILKDFTTLLYAKILLNQMSLDLFQKQLLPELSNANFAFQANARELINVYYITNKEYGLVKIDNLNMNAIPLSLKSRLQTLFQEAQILQKKL